MAGPKTAPTAVSTAAVDPTDLAKSRTLTDADLVGYLLCRRDQLTSTAELLAHSLGLDRALGCDGRAAGWALTCPAAARGWSPNEEADATRKLAGEEERIPGKYDMCPGCTIEDYGQAPQDRGSRRRASRGRVFGDADIDVSTNLIENPMGSSAHCVAGSGVYHLTT